MLKKEYTVFAAFLLVNAMLAMNCFTASLWYKVGKQESQNRKTQYRSEEMNVRRDWNENFESLNSENPTKSPDINLHWTLNDSYSKNNLIKLVSKSFRNAICIVVNQKKDKYVDPNISICSVWNDPSNSIHAISRELSEKEIETRIDQIEEIILNPKYADNIVFLLKDETYLVVNTTKLYPEENSWELITTPNDYLTDFLNNSKEKLIRKKINTIVRVNYKTYSKSYISFLSVDKEKNRVVILEWENIYDSKKDTKFIPLSLLYPVTVVMDIFLMPIGAILFFTGILPFSINTE
ncbi:MAG: hypothetical protein IPO06_30425 [Leptospiraceae bacterium]|nr:hypothetical protein [Leptospiraceae bacterium]MBK9503622.1 hypothetical protein [Leptospiraceae bacterium]